MILPKKVVHFAPLVGSYVNIWCVQNLNQIILQEFMSACRTNIRKQEREKKKTEWNTTQNKSTKSKSNL